MIPKLYRALARAYGPLHWWPARTRFEVIVGAFLTQNTSWRNVERALRNLRRQGALKLDSLRRMPLEEVEQLIRPSGYFRQKASRLKNFIAYLDDRHSGSLSHMFAQPIDVLRNELLELNGIGPETADAILLYAGKLPVFVVDAYAKRVFERHGILKPGEKYEHVRSLVESSMKHNQSASESAEQFNELHALLVEVGKRHCRTIPNCEGCPLQPLLPTPLLSNGNIRQA